MSLSHQVTYQGFKVRAVKYRRTDGLSPETGYVDVSIKDLKSISIKMPQIPWRNAKPGAKEIPGQLGIEQTMRLYSGELQGRNTVAETNEKPSKGLNLVGDLVFESFKQGATLGKTVYKDVYVAFEGIEEITEKLAAARSHSEGFIRIPLSDIRQFYSDYGLLFQSINCRLRSGHYDPRTVQAGGDPWSLPQVVQYLFSQLPGSPAVHSKSVIFSMEGNPPNEIIGEGEPVAGILQDVLNQYGLVGKMQPTGDYLVEKKWARKSHPGQVSKSPGQFQNWSGGMKTEKKSVSGTNRPPLVCVKGKRRVQRVTLPYVPIVQWTDGRYYQLSDIGSLIPGYDLTSVQDQTLNNEGKNFQNVIGKAPSGAVGYQWMQMLRKWAYKGYAPASSFSEGPNPSLTSSPQGFVPTVPGSHGSTPQKRTLPVISDEDFEFLPFLPAVNGPWYKSDLNLPGMDMMFKGASSKRGESGDADEVVLLPPVVKSRTIGEMWFENSSEITRHLERVAKSYGKDKEYCDARVRICQDRASSIISHINATNRNAANVARMQGISSSPLPVIEIDEEVRTLAKNFGTFEPDVKRVVDDFGLGVPIKAALSKITIELAAWKKSAEDADQALKNALKTVTTYQAVYASYRGFMGIGNLPVKIAERGKYSFDSNSGIILFTEPQCIGSSALVMSDEWQRVVGDGSVSVSFGYALRFNGIQDWTTVYVSPKPAGPGEPATAAISGYSRPSGIKSRLERMPDVTLYLDEYGNPMNLTFVTDAAVRKAQFQVSQPDGVEGYQNIYHGFATCVLDEGLNCVQHSWEGGKSAAYTDVFQNFPGGVGPLGPAMTPTLSAAEGRARARAAMAELER